MGIVTIFGKLSPKNVEIVTLIYGNCDLAYAVIVVNSRKFSE